MKISCIIPCKNEGNTIVDVMESVRNFCDELIVVDGGSTDNTLRILRTAGVKFLQDNGRGKGDGMITGAAAAAGDILVFLDADGSHNPQDIPSLIEPILKNEADLVIGSRIRGGSDEAFSSIENVARMLGGFFLSFAMKKIWKTELTDCLNGFRAIKKEKFSELDLRCMDFVIEEEMVIKLLKNHGRIREIPSHEFVRKSGVSKLKTSQGWKFILYFLKSVLFL